MTTHFLQPQTGTDVTSAIVDALRTGLGDRLISVVLFGSRARQEGRADSDWDLLVIAAGLPETTFARRLYLKNLLPASCRGAASILARTPAEFEAQLSSLYLDVALDGRVLYDPAGYVNRKLAALRQQLGEIGLYRERSPAGDWWRWRNTAPPNWRENWLK
ncbi:MAG: nucleotidyltransferase domain-containing protein [Anaerolineae bacterium]